MVKKILLDDLRKFSEEALVKTGVSSENAAMAAEVLITTDTFGVITRWVQTENRKEIKDAIRSVS